MRCSTKVLIGVDGRSGGRDAIALARQLVSAKGRCTGELRQALGDGAHRQLGLVADGTAEVRDQHQAYFALAELLDRR
jgi:hypothetical protein